MHTYSTNANERSTRPIVLAAIAISFAWMLGHVLNLLHLNVAWWVEAPSITGFYGFLYVWFDRYGWRSRRGIPLSEIPDLNGTWVGQIRSSHEVSGEPTETTVVLW